MTLRPTTLRKSLLLPQLVLAATVAAYVFGWWLPSSLAEAEAQHLRLVERHLETVEQDLIPLILGNQLDIIYGNLTAEMGQNPDWTDLRLTDARGRQLYPLRTVRRPPPAPAADLRTLSDPIVLLGSPVGTLTAEIDVGPALAQQRHGLDALAALITTLLGAMLAATLLSLELTVLRPLRKLATAALALARRRFDTALPPSGDDEMGALVTSFATMRDDLQRFQDELLAEITMRRDSEARLQDTVDRLAQSNSELEHFAHIASHDLREPLRTMISFSQLLERRFADMVRGDAREYLDFIIASARRMNLLVDGLLDYARADTRNTPFEAVDLGEVAAEACTVLRPEIEERQATLCLGALPTVMGNPTQMLQVFDNLLSNALKFGPREGRPQIAVETLPAVDGMREVVFCDNGIGIEPEYLEQIFVLYNRLHPGTTYPGAGVGLAICKRIVERHGGRIWAESVPGEGTRVHVTLPAA